MKTFEGNKVIYNFLSFLIITAVFLGLLNVKPINAQPNPAKLEGEIASLEIVQGEFIRKRINNDKILSLSLDVKTPHEGVNYYWQIGAPPYFGVAQVTPSGSSVEVSYESINGHTGEDFFIVVVHDDAGAKAQTNISVALEPNRLPPKLTNTEVTLNPEPGNPIIEDQYEHLNKEERLEEGYFSTREEKRPDLLKATESLYDSSETREGPYFQVSLYFGAICTGEWTTNLPLSLIIDDPNTATVEDYSDTIISSDCFNISGFKLEPGQFVTVSDGTITKTHTIIDIVVTDFDEEADTLTGKANPGIVEIFADDGNTFAWRYPEANEEGLWEADFSGLVDISMETTGKAFQKDSDGDYTSTSWSIPDPYMQVFPLGDDILGRDWKRNNSVTLYIGENKWEAQTDDRGNVDFDLDPFDIIPGHEIVMTDGTSTRTHFATSLTVTGFDVDTDTVSGTAEAGTVVYLDAQDEYNLENLSVTTDFSGNWEAEFIILDIASGANGYAYQLDDEGNSTCIYWYVPDPDIEVYPYEHKIYGNQWIPNTQITLSIGASQWQKESDKDGCLYFNIDPFEILPDTEVVMTDGTYTRSHNVTSLAITTVDEENNIVNGTAAPGSLVTVTANDDYYWESIEINADTSGHWIADFTSMIDFASGTKGHARQCDFEENSTNVNWEVPDPYLNVYPMGDYIFGYEWTPGIAVSATIDSVYKGSGVPNQDGRVYIDLTDDLVPGQLVELTDGIYTRSHIIQNLFVTNIDQSNDFVQGTADPYSELSAYACENDLCHWVYPQADEFGNWTSNYSGHVNITTESYGWVYRYDNQDNSTRVHWFTIDPSFIVKPHDGEIYGSQWSPETTVTLTIGSHTWTQESDGYNGSVYFYPDIELSPGLTVQMTDGITTRTHTIIDLAVTDFDAAADTLSGTADPGELTIYTCDSFDCYYRYPVADVNGNWTADFFGVTDIEPGSAGWMYQYDADGDETQMYWSLPNPRISAHPNADTIYGYEWTPNTQVSLSIGSVPIEIQESSNSGDVYFELETHELLPGQVVEMSDGTYTKTHTVINLAVTGYDEILETMMGTANPGELTIDAWGDGDEMLYPEADLNGDWNVQFTSMNLAPDAHAGIYQYDEDNDLTYIHWLIPNPAITAYLSSNFIRGSNWSQNTDITLTIDNTRETWTEKSNESGYVSFKLDPYILQPGDSIEMTSGTYTQTHTVKNIVVTQIDSITDVLHGTANPEGKLIVCAHDYTNYYLDSECITTNPDSTGAWEANFSGLIDIRPGIDGSVRQYDENENYTDIYWFAGCDNHLFLPLILR